MSWVDLVALLTLAAMVFIATGLRSHESGNQLGEGLALAIVATLLVAIAVVVVVR